MTVQTVPGGSLQLGGVAGQQVEQTLALELQSQPGEKKRRMACTCPNCKDAEKRQVLTDSSTLKEAGVGGEEGEREREGEGERGRWRDAVCLPLYSHFQEKLKLKFQHKSVCCQ